MRAYQRFLKYVTAYTTSDEGSGTMPTTERQFDLARTLADELRTLGCEGVTLDDKCYVYAYISATPGCEDKPHIGFLAHMDTSPDFSGEGVKPCIHENYDGENVPLGTSGLVLSAATFPHLKNLRGRTLITTDGTTLLGADDKAGVAEIMTMAERLMGGEMPHGKICIAFTPDEEVGRGTDGFDVKRFDAEFAYTVDGGAEGELEYENFNAAGARFDIKGVSVHPGSAKGIMINAGLVACELATMLPTADTPALTEGYEGFFHMTDIKGDCSNARVDYIVRDHDSAMFEARLTILRHVEKTLNERYGEGTVTLTMVEQYRNMKEKIEPCMHLVDNAKKACELCDVTPRVMPIRGGTDGARLSYMGLPCPNLGTGGYGFHGPYEHITIEGMDKATDILMAIVDIYSK